MTAGGDWWTFSVEIAIFRRKSQHYRGSGLPGRRSDVFYHAFGDPGPSDFQHYRESGVPPRGSDVFYHVSGDPVGTGAPGGRHRAPGRGEMLLAEACKAENGVGLAWAGWLGLAWPGLAWAGLGWSALGWPGLGCPGLAWAGLCWAMLGSAGRLAQTAATAAVTSKPLQLPPFEANCRNWHRLRLRLTD